MVSGGIRETAAATAASTSAAAWDSGQEDATVEHGKAVFMTEEHDDEDDDVFPLEEDEGTLAD